MFATDIDLLVLEPNLFAEIGWAGQRTVSAVGSLSGTTLTLSGVDLAAAQVDAGSVVMLSGVPLEVVARLSAATLSVSLVRWGRTGPAIPPVGITTGLCEVTTFRQQIGEAHRMVLRMLGVREGVPPASAPGSDAPPLGEAAVTNGADFASLEALLTLHNIFAAVGAAAVGGAPLTARADQYRRRAAAERSRCAALLDTNGDGVADATRRLGVIPLLRG